MNEVDALNNLIKETIIETFQKCKTDLFNSDGTIFGRNWADLTPKYKKYKEKKRGSAYPLNNFTGKLFLNLITKALVVDVDYDSLNDDLKYSMSVDLGRMDVEYAEEVNEAREYLSFSDEEKKLISEAITKVIENYHGGLD